MTACDGGGRGELRVEDEVGVAGDDKDVDN